MSTTAVKTLEEINKLVYDSSNNLSVVNVRNLVKHSFERQSYTPGQKMVCRTSSGSAYVDGRQSYLHFELQSTTATTVGIGSAMNVIRSIMIKSRGGKIIDRIDNFNLYALHRDAMDCGEDWHTSAGTSLGYGATGLDVAQRFSIPLNRLSGFWDVDKLIPSQLSAGLEITIELEQSDRALVGTSTTYTVTDPSIVYDSYLLVDAIALDLKNQAQKGDIMYPYVCVTDLTTNVPASSGRAVVEVNDSRARVLDIVSISQIDPVAEDTEDRMKAENYNLTQYQFKLGEAPYPEFQIDNAEEAYQNLLYIHDRVRHCHNPPRVNKSLFATGGYGLMGAVFERSNILNFAGIPTNVGRSIRGTIVYNDAAPVRTLYTYVRYLCQMTVFVENILLSS